MIHYHIYKLVRTKRTRLEFTTKTSHGDFRYYTYVSEEDISTMCKGICPNEREREKAIKKYLWEWMKTPSGFPVKKIPYLSDLYGFSATLERLKNCPKNKFFNKMLEKIRSRFPAEAKVEIEIFHNQISVTYPYFCFHHRCENIEKQIKMLQRRLQHLEFVFFHYHPHRGVITRK